MSADRSKSRKSVDAAFEGGIPEDFVQHYSLELMSWGRDFARRGPNCLIELRRIPNMPVLVTDAWGQVPRIGVRLSARVDRARRGDDYVRLIITPETEDDLRKIVKHMADVARFGPPVAPVGRPRERATIEVPGVQ